MRYYQIGGYQGPVTVLTRDDAELAHAACRSTAEKGYDSGADRWSGELRRVSPAGVIGAGVYRLQFPGGAHGDVMVRTPTRDSAFVYFVGIAGHPLYPQATAADRLGAAT